RGHLGQASASMGKIPLTEPLSATISNADTVALGCPVDADEPALHFVHAMLPLSISNRRDLSLSLYWRSRRGLPTGPQLAATHRGTGPPQVLTKKIGAQGAVGCSRRVGSVRQAYQRPVWTARRMVQGARASRALRNQASSQRWTIAR